MVVEVGWSGMWSVVRYEVLTPDGCGTSGLRHLAANRIEHRCHHHDAGLRDWLKTDPKLHDSQVLENAWALPAGSFVRSLLVFQDIHCDSVSALEWPHVVHHTPETARQSSKQVNCPRLRGACYIMTSSDIRSYKSQNLDWHEMPSSQAHYSCLSEAGGLISSPVSRTWRRE